MQGLRIDFTGSAPRISFDRPAKGFESTTQRALVNIGTHKDDINLFEDKGTDLLRRGAEGSIVSTQEARHQSNFAAIKTLRFVKQNSPITLDPTEELSRVGLLPVTPIDSNRLQIQASFTSAAGEVVGITGNL